MEMVRHFFVSIVPMTAILVLVFFLAYPATLIISEFSTIRQTDVWLWRATWMSLFKLVLPVLLTVLFAIILGLASNVRVDSF